MPLIAAGQGSIHGLGPDREPHQAGGDRRAAAARVCRTGCGRTPTDCAPDRQTALQTEIDLLERMFAHSLKFVLPMTIAPAARAARPERIALVTLLTRARLRSVVGNDPNASILSLISTGCPAIAPRLRFDPSKARAWSIAVGSTAITECSCGSIRAMRSNDARTFASAERAG